MNTPTLTILVPVFNEQRTLHTIMHALTSSHPDAQIIYIDDGSSDGSLELLRKDSRPQDIVLTKKNGGKGSAIRLGLTHATGDYTVIQDADLEYDPKEIAMLLAEAKAHPGCAVFGSRFLRDNPNIYKRFLLGNKVLTFCMNILFGTHLTDSYTCYKLLPTENFRSLHLHANGFELEAEICARAVRSGIPIREVAISYHPRTIAEGKKINWKDAWRGLKMMMQIRFRPTHAPLSRVTS